MKTLTLTFIVTVTLFMSSAQQMDWVGQFSSTSNTGNVSNVESTAIDKDANGNVYIAGTFAIDSADFDPGPGTYYMEPEVSTSAFVCKLDSLGNLIWAKRFGGSSSLKVNNITVDQTGAVYITGSFFFTVDFDPGPGVFNLSVIGGADLYLSKLDSNGDFQWAMSTGGSVVDQGYDVATDSDDNVYFVGRFDYGDFDPGLGSAIHNPSETSGFIAKYDPNGNYINSGMFESSAITSNWGASGHSIVFDPSGYLYVTGFFREEVDADPGPGATIITNTTATGSVYISKLDTSLNLVWVEHFGAQFVFDLVLDNMGNPIITGEFVDTVDFDPGPGIFSLSTPSSFDKHTFINKLNPNGDFLWARQYAKTLTDGIGTNTFHDIYLATDINSNVYLMGSYFDTIDLDPGPGTLEFISQGNSDIYITQLDSTGSMLWGGTMGGPEYDYAGGLFVNNEFKMYHTGIFTDTADLDPTTSGTTLYSPLNYDSYIQITKDFDTYLSLTESSIDHQVIVFPNPTDYSIMIQLGNFSPSYLELADLTGEVIENRKLNKENQIKLVIDQSPGIYILTLRGGDGKVVKRIIKK